jgi:hypothetical protein
MNDTKPLWALALITMTIYIALILSDWGDYKKLKGCEYACKQKCWEGE